MIQLSTRRRRRRQGADLAGLVAGMVGGLLGASLSFDRAMTAALVPGRPAQPARQAPEEAEFEVIQ